MATYSKITDLTAATAITSGSVFEVADAGASKQVTASVLAAYRRNRSPNIYFRWRCGARLQFEFHRWSDISGYYNHRIAEYDDSDIVLYISQA